MQDNLKLLLQWREIDQNGYLASHSGEATSIFGVASRHGGTHDGTAAGYQPNGQGVFGVASHHGGTHDGTAAGYQPNGHGIFGVASRQPNGHDNDDDVESRSETM